MAEQRLRVDRGTSQTGMRIYNERLVLSIIRRQGSLGKVEIAKLSGLTTQTTTVIVNRLEADKLLVAGAPQRGRVGQPTVPYSLNPEGAFSCGLRIGRRSTDLVLVDFVANIRARKRLVHTVPSPDEIMRFVEREMEPLLSVLSPAKRKRVMGLGVATPFELWNWADYFDAPAGILEGWRNFDMASALAELVDPWPVHVHNDATSACAAEVTFGNPDGFQDFAYFYVGTFVGGGVVINGSLFPGRSKNAGALGSMPVLERSQDGTSDVQQLIHIASINRLEHRLAAAGHARGGIWLEEESGADETQFAEVIDEWIDDAARALAQASAAALATIDFECIVIDGSFPESIRSRLVERTREHFGKLDRQGLPSAEIREGAVGQEARAIGGAALPLLAAFSADREVLFRDLSKD